ncbi:MAG: hypothetical protein MMC23_000287 [Stictis urceolatum]|nr:hypothetical protein [Stictis urceolata]
MAGEARSFREVDIAITSAQLWKHRFPPNDPEDAPSATSFRMNLTGISHYQNLYFVAYGAQIYVYRPEFPTEKLGKCLFRWSPTPTGIIGIQTMPTQHCINQLLISDLGNDEVISTAHDEGDYIVCTVRSVREAFEAVLLGELNESEAAEKCIRYVHRSNVGHSAWGIAAHKNARLLAVSANSMKITVYAPALTSKGGTGDGPDRSHDKEMSLSGHAHNVPCIAFCNTDADMHGKYLVSTDIEGSILIWDIWKRCGIKKISMLGISCVGIDYAHSYLGWSITCVEPQAFWQVSNDLELVGFERGAVEIDNSDKYREHLDVSKGRHYLRDHTLDWHLGHSLNGQRQQNQRIHRDNANGLLDHVRDVIRNGADPSAEQGDSDDDSYTAAIVQERSLFDEDDYDSSSAEEEFSRVHGSGISEERVLELNGEAEDEALTEISSDDSSDDPEMSHEPSPRYRSGEPETMILADVMPVSNNESIDGLPPGRILRGGSDDNMSDEHYDVVDFGPRISLTRDQRYATSRLRQHPHSYSPPGPRTGSLQPRSQRGWDTRAVHIDPRTDFSDSEDENDEDETPGPPRHSNPAYRGILGTDDEPSVTSQRVPLPDTTRLAQNPHRASTESPQTTLSRILNRSATPTTGQADSITEADTDDFTYNYTPPPNFSDLETEDTFSRRFPARQIVSAINAQAPDRGQTLHENWVDHRPHHPSPPALTRPSTKLPARNIPPAAPTPRDDPIPFNILHTGAEIVTLLRPPFEDATAICVDPCHQHIQRNLLGLMQHDRLCLTSYIPDISIFIAGTQAGRVAVFSLCELKAESRRRKARETEGFKRTPLMSKIKGWGRDQHAMRLDWVLPFKSQEARGDRPTCPLMGLSSAPVQGEEKVEDGLRIGRGGMASGKGKERARQWRGRWRLMLTYMDNTVLTYELWREELGGIGVGELVT